MAHLPRTFWVAHAWLMAVLTLASGLPHRQCVCPDGRVKWFCLHSSSDACCCHSACCARRDSGAAPSPAARPCCCRHQPWRSSPAGGPDRVLTETPCRKSWVPSSVVVDRPTREAGPAQGPQSPALFAALPADARSTPEGTCEPGRRANRAPPLPDRFILLQRLLL